MFSISLRGMLVWIAWAAIVLLSLMYASELWVALVAGLAMLMFFGALANSIAARGTRRAGAIVFCLTMAAYAWIVLNMPDNYGDTSFAVELNPIVGELMPGRLPTTRLLGYVYQVMDRGQRVSTNPSERFLLPPPSVESVPLETTPPPSAPTITYSENPPRAQFMIVGHLWWSLLLGCLTARYAQWIYVRGSREQESTESG